MSAEDLNAAAAAFEGLGAVPETPSAPEQEETPPEEKRVPTVEVLYPLARLAFDKAAPLWALSDAEVFTLCQSYGDLLDKYFPDGLNFGVELSAAMATLTIIGPRWGKPLKPEPPKPAAAPTAPTISEPKAA